MKQESKTIMSMMDGYKKSIILATAIRLKVFENIGLDYTSILDVSSKCRVKVEPLTRLLRALDAMGLVCLCGNDVVLTALGLSTINDPELKDYLTVSSYDWIPAWGDLFHAVYFNSWSDGSSWEKRAKNSEVNKAFHNLMRYSDVPNIPIYLDEGSTVVDVGCGLGHTLAAVLKSNPTFKGVLFDLPSVIKLALENITTTFKEVHATNGPIEFVEGSFLDSVPPGGDLYILSNVLHDWDDDCAKKILANCFKAMKDGAKLVVTETFIPEKGNDEYASMTDIHLMVVHGGKKRTRSKYVHMLTDAGFRVVSKYIDSVEVIK